MTKRYVLKEKAAQLGISVTDLVLRVYETEKTEMKTAIALGVYPNAIRHHLKKARESASRGARLVTAANVPRGRRAGGDA